MCFFCLILFFDTFLSMGFKNFFAYILRRNRNFSIKLLIRLKVILFGDNRLIGALAVINHKLDRKIRSKSKLYVQS